MTMRLDIVTNDAGELVRREHARELGAGVVVSIYRLVKLAQMHDLGNQAFLRQLEQTHQMIGEYCLRSGSNVSVLFADKATFVAGQLLKGNRGAYEAAAELGALLERLGGSELSIARDLTREDCLAFAEQVSIYHRTGNASQLRLPPKIHLRQVADAARLRGIELENLSPDQRIVRAYASAVVIMRRFFEDLAASRYVLPRRIKRIAQSLVDLSDASTASYLGVTEVRNANYDEAGRAANTAILAVSIAREATQDRGVLCQIALAAMMHDVARPRALALAASAGAPMPGMAGPTTLSEDQEDRLAAGAAAVLTALGRVNEASINRTVLTFEALWLRRRTWLGPVYWGARPPTLQATIVAVARRYNDLLTPEPGLVPPTTDFAVATLAGELVEPQDRTVLRMLVSALGLLPTGTVVQLSSGEVAEVVRGSRGLGDKPRVKIIADAAGAAVAQSTEIELAQDARRIHRVLGVDGWRKGLEQEPQAFEPGPDSDDDDVPNAPMSTSGLELEEVSAQQPSVWAAEEQSRAETSMSGEHSTGASLPSLGSSPSAVAEAMGRMISDSLAPQDLSREADRPDRTVFQPQSPDDAPARRVPSAPSREATARGNLAATPLPHVLVYMLDHGLTGSVVFEGTRISPDGVDDTIYFVAGVPAKIRLSETIAQLGEVLVEDGSLDAARVDRAVEGARHLGILLGEFLVGHDLVSRESLALGLEGQLLRKIAHVANLAPAIEYAYYRDLDLLEGWGGEIAASHPLNPILASVRHWTDRARVRATLNRIGKHPLAIHPDADLTNIAVVAEEQRVLDALRSEDMTLSQLFKLGLADDEVVSSLIYTLAVTRQFAFKGQKKGPMAARGTWKSASASGVGPSPGARASSPAGSGLPSSVPNASGPRPAMPVSVGKQVAAAPVAAIAGGAPAVGGPAAPKSPSGAPPIVSSTAKMRAAPPATTASAPPSTRAPTPAIRTAGAVRPGPQIRPIGMKPTMMGLQPSALSEGKQPPPPVRPSSGSSSERLGGAARADGEGGPAEPPSSPGGGRTIAMLGAPPIHIAKRSPVAGARPAAPLPNGEQGAPGAIPATDPAAEAVSSFRLAEGALERNDAGAAEEHARKAVAADPTQPDYVTLLAWIRALGGAPQAVEDAIRTMSKVLIEDPSNERALLYRARLLVRTNRLPEALNDFSELLSANPNHAEAQNEARELRDKLPS
jgi:hypothetical protein